MFSLQGKDASKPAGKLLSIPVTLLIPIVNYYGVIACCVFSLTLISPRWRVCVPVNNLVFVIWTKVSTATSHPHHLSSLISCWLPSLWYEEDSWNLCQKTLRLFNIRLLQMAAAALNICRKVKEKRERTVKINPYPTAFPYGNGMVLHFYQQQESSTTKTVHKVINKGLKAYV